MKSRHPMAPFAPHEIRGFLMPVTMASLLTLTGMFLASIFEHITPGKSAFYYGVAGIFYIVLGNILLVRIVTLPKRYSFFNALILGFGLGFFTLSIPDNLVEIAHILIIFSSITIATMSGRKHTHLSLIGILAISLPSTFPKILDITDMLEYFMPLFTSVVIIEVIIRIKETANQHVHRLETINKVSRQIMQSLDTKQTINLLDMTIKETLVADTYFLGFLKDDEIKLELFFDDGKYFNGTHVPLEGTLSGWVIKNQKELFLPDLREEVQLDGVLKYVIGAEKTSLSWIGVPLKAENVTGILALASYTANTFDRADIELLVSLGQHVTLALDNTIRHAQVERQAHLDSLTGVYNHGYFLKLLSEQAEESIKNDSPLSVIMLDIDYFKQYNDTYGHLLGDRVLTSLCSIIQHNIKQADAVGRWGGEEFVISLPGADGKEALKIAKRISETMKALRVEDHDQRTVPIPTISQGISVFCRDADEIYRLIDIADKRLYIAKKRGRDQIEFTEDSRDS